MTTKTRKAREARRIARLGRLAVDTAVCNQFVGAKLDAEGRCDRPYCTRCRPESAPWLKIAAPDADASELEGFVL